MDDKGEPSPLIGRRRELDTLVDRLKRARGGRAGLVLVRGAPGVGKSRLLAAATDEAALLGFRVLSGRADELERGVAYAALRDAFGPALAAEENPVLAGVVGEVRRALLGAGDGGEGDEPAHAFAAGEQLLRAWSDREPVLLALDDLHAADEDTLAVVSLLARTLRDTRVGLVATLRADPPDLGVELAAMVERLGGQPDVTVIDLDPFDPDDVVALAASRLGAPPDEQLTAQLVNLTRGNAFFVEELLRAYRDGGAIELRDGRAGLVDRAPAVTLTSRTAVLHRVFSLGRDVRAVARVLTALQRIDLDRLELVASLAGLDAPSTERAFDVLVRARILDADGAGGFEFVHPIVRATLDGDLGPAERRRIHSLIAEHLRTARRAGVPVDVLELATHVAHAAVAGDAEAIAILTEAGDLTAARAPRSAGDWYARALALLPGDAGERGSILARRARALYLAQRKGDAATDAEAAVALLPEGVERERTAVVLAASLRALGRMDDALAVTDSLLGDGSAALLAERASLLVHVDRFDEADAAAARAVASARDPRSVAMARLVQAQCAYARGEVSSALAQLDDLLGEVDGLPAATAVNLRIARASYLAYSGLVTDAEAAIADVESRLGELGEVAFRTAIDPPTVWALGLAGRWDEALERAHRATLEFERSGELFLLALIRTMEAWILLERGAVGAATEVLTTATDVPLARSAVAWVRAGIAAAVGRLDGARAELLDALVTDERTGRRTALPLLLARLVEIELRAGRDGAAAGHLARLDESASVVGTPWARCLAARSRAAVDRDPALARAAHDIAASAGLGFEAATSGLLVGELDPSAGDELRQAYEALRALGAEPSRRRAAAALRAGGYAVPRGRAERESGLTSTERQLARLVTEGMTNKEIANVLFLSPKTVEVYLSRLYAKVACTSRVELAVAVESGALTLAEDDR